MALLVRSEQSTRKLFTSAFTLIELLVVVTILGIMSTVGYLSMNKLQTTTDTQTSLDKLIASIKTQRIYAMLGNSATHTKAMPQGIYFQTGSNTFVLFRCEELQHCSYVPEANTNTIDSIEKTLVFSTVSLPGNQVIFAPLSGEVANFDSNLNMVRIENLIDHSVTTMRVTQIGTLEITH